MSKSISIVGAGPGGMTAAMLLAHQGFHVQVFEKAAEVGGRNAAIHLDGYTFDTGPTFLMMDFVLREAFQEAGHNIEDFLELVRLDPLYHLHFPDFSLDMTSDHAVMEQRLEKVFPGSGPGFRRFLAHEKKRFEMLMPCLQKPYGSWKDYLSLDLVKALPWLSAGKSMFEELGEYFESEKLRIAFTFQSKYLGMSAWQCPALFTMIPYVEHGLGIYHVQGGLNRISHAMRAAAEKDGAVFHMSTPVAKVLTENGKACGIVLADGRKIASDAVVVNADFGHAMHHLFDPKDLRKYQPAKVDKLGYSCSTFMLYLGLDKLYDLPHHSIWFSDDYHGNIDDIFTHRRLSAEPSFYVQNASVTDPHLAPEGHSALYVLMPCTNMQAGIDWDQEKSRLREQLIGLLETRAGMQGIRDHIRAEKVLTPADWQGPYGVHFGATFNLAHNYGQLLGNRPHNAFDDVDGVYLVGGGTHPGSGLPTIYESARISSRLITERLAKS